MKFELRPARRGDLFTRLLIFGESGQGKTYGALAIAFHLAELYGYDPTEIAVLDTETVESPDRDNATGSAEKYAGRPCNCNRCLRQGITFKGGADGFQTMIMEEGHRGPESFCRALQVCKQSGIKIVILDGITAEWRALLQLVDKVDAQTRGKGDGWSTARPLHNQFVRALMEYPGHVIATCRAKKESRHKKAEKGEGDVLPDQDGNVLYEYDVALFVKRGTGYVVKTRDDRLENCSSRHPGADMADSLKRWCDDPDARTRSVVGQHQAETEKAAPLPDVAPNTRTDVVQGQRVAAATGPDGPFPDGGNDNDNRGDSVDQLIATAEANIDRLRELDLGAFAEQSRSYPAVPTNRVEAGVSQLLARQEHVIEERSAAMAKAAAKEIGPVAQGVKDEFANAAEELRSAGFDVTDHSGEDDPTEGYSDLPF